MASNSEIANTEKPLFELDIPHEGTKLAPRSFDELVAWLERQRQFWNWLNQAKADDGQLEALFNVVFHQERGITKSLNAATGAGGESGRQHIEILRNLLTERFNTHQVPTSESPIAQYVAQLARSDKVVAAHALWALMRKDPLPTNRPARAFRGQTLAVLYDHEPKRQAKSHQATWTELHRRISDEHEALRREAGKLSDAYRKVSEDIHDLHENQRKTFDETQATRASEFGHGMVEHRATMKNIEDTFKRELSLRSAVEYLNKKADQHRTVAWIAGVAALLVGGAFTGLAAYVGLTVFKDAKDLPIPQISVAVLAATLVFWLLRILVRVLLSNLHLRTDMRARSTFVHTYLALLAEGGGIKDEDRALVIGLVFRPISDGLVRDDATPPGLWDLVTKNLSGRG